MYPQPGGAFPGQAPPPYPPQAAPPGRKKTWILVAAGVALALVAGIGGWFAMSGSDDDSDKTAPAAADKSANASPGASPSTGASAAPPPKRDLAQKWTLKAPVGTDGKPMGLDGGWALGAKAYVIAETGITIHDAATGTEKGKLQVPAGFAQVCSVMAAPVDGSGYFAWEGADGNCTNVSAVDLAQDKILWTYKMPDDMSFRVAIGAHGDTVVVGADSDVVALDRRTGTARWTWHSEGAGTMSEWEVSDVGVGPGHVAVTVQLSSLDRKIKYVGGLVVIDLASGAQKGFTKFANGPNSWPSLMSASPIVVLDEYDDAKEEKQAKISVFDGNAQRTVDLPVGLDGIVMADRGFDSLDPNQYMGAVEVRGNVLYAQLGTQGDTSNIGAYDLTTGKQLWKVSAGFAGDVRLISADDQGFTALIGEGFMGSEAQVIRFAAADGKPTTVHVLQAKSMEVDAEGSAYILPGDLVVQFSTGSSADDDVVQVFGAG